MKKPALFVATSILFLPLLPLAAQQPATGTDQAAREIALPKPEDPVVLPTDEEVAREAALSRETWLKTLQCRTTIRTAP